MLKNYLPGRCYIIAEIGGNFITFDEAKALVDAAARCGVDAVKLQTYRAETVSSKSALFDMENTGRVSQYELFKKYEISEALHRKIFAYADNLGLDRFSTPSHETDLEMLERLGVEAYKVGSDDAVNLPFLKEIAGKGKPVFLATGMCTLDEVGEAVSVILGEGNPALTLLHAVTSYPTHPEDVNLRAMKAMRSAFGLPVGYSDHTMGITAALAAVALGAAVLEKHFTLDKAAEGPDHMLSADPAEMKTLVEQVRQVELMLGHGIKMPAPSEKGTRMNNRKSLVAARELKPGERIGPSDITIKRPGWGIEPKHSLLVTGRRVTRAIKEDEVLSWKDLA
ncbi:MAG: N-acylneuraminate-9-phosphate synthase [Nitrospirales bacterium]|nr:N-acylneuraminate-9-phosphate synthase [Nitrospirales bacterium]